MTNAAVTTFGALQCETSLLGTMATDVGIDTETGINVGCEIVSITIGGIVIVLDVEITSPDEIT